MKVNAELSSTEADWVETVVTLKPMNQSPNLEISRFRKIESTRKENVG